MTKALDAAADNVFVSMLGGIALDVGAPGRAGVGDSIDRGLILLRLLRASGFEVRVLPHFSHPMNGMGFCSLCCASLSEPRIQTDCPGGTVRSLTDGPVGVDSPLSVAAASWLSIQRHLGLHQELIVNYVVDGYQASLHREDQTVICTAKGDSISAALAALDRDLALVPEERR